MTNVGEIGARAKAKYIDKYMQRPDNERATRVNKHTQLLKHKQKNPTQPTNKCQTPRNSKTANGQIAFFLLNSFQRDEIKCTR